MRENSESPDEARGRVLNASASFGGDLRWSHEGDAGLNGSPRLPKPT